ncbi:MAG: methyltransferase domain-containing protein [Chloroflexota bacterium]|nr:MAG: methyltransferase domain-containing protein [Chloroflexota bacterium]
MSKLSSEAEYWNRVSGGWHVRGYSNKLLGEHKRKTYLNLLARWVDITAMQRILKTDLFAEAFVVEQFLFDIAQENSNIIAFDVASEIVTFAKSNAERHGVNGGEYLCCDVKHIPLQDNSIDLIISDSTLDHFPTEADIITALMELGRVLRTDGVLILSIDNKRNLSYPPYFLIRLWMWLKLSPYFIGRTLALSKLKHVLEEIGLNVEESTAILHYPHPDGLVRWLEHSLRKLGRGKFDNAISRTLACLEGMEKRRIKYLTGRYIAVKAVKRR